MKVRLGASMLSVHCVHFLFCRISRCDSRGFPHYRVSSVGMVAPGSFAAEVLQ